MQWYLIHNVSDYEKWKRGKKTKKEGNPQNNEMQKRVVLATFVTSISWSTIKAKDKVLYSHTTAVKLQL
jgi:hypothetical protein